MSVVSTYRTKPLSKVMVLDVIARDGKKLPLHFLGRDENVNSPAHFHVIKEVVLPWPTANNLPGGAGPHFEVGLEVIC